jgi:hypothetical protein
MEEVDHLSHNDPKKIMYSGDIRALNMLKYLKHGCVK